ncbi:MAG: 3-hydroxyacyl-ACP dehydratase FabZ [Thermodesulfobacteriota bacterium]|nr:3-hydroxyacyl-ACP dehydratase FabZ [Thermodesulfobacteriota bacterium]
MTTELDLLEILNILPHRYPFLLVDRVTSYELKKTILAYKNVTYNEPFFQGHFPDRPVMPGVLIVEAMAQAGGILAYLSLESEHKLKHVFFMGIDKVKFRRPVVPGDRLDLKVDLVRLGSRFWKFRGEAFVGDQKAAEADLVAGSSDGTK